MTPKEIRQRRFALEGGFLKPRRARLPSVSFKDFAPGTTGGRTLAPRSRKPDDPLEPVVIGRAPGIVMYENDSRIFV